MKYLAENMLGRTFCPLGDAAAMPIISLRARSSAKSLRSTWNGGRARIEKSAEPALV